MYRGYIENVLWLCRKLLSVGGTWICERGMEHVFALLYKAEPPANSPCADENSNLLILKTVRATNLPMPAILSHLEI